MAQDLKNKIVVLEPCTKIVEDLLKTITDRKQAELIRVSIPEEAVQLVRQFQPCMLVVCIQENNELPQRVSLLKNLESSIKYGLLKTVFVSKVKNKQVSTLITSLGVTDFMEEPVPLRTLQFKANIQLKAIETIRKQQEMKKASQEKIVFKKNGQKEEGEASGDPQAKPAPALQLDEDAFLFKNSGVKKNGKKMVVELEGPDPASGEWVSHEDKGNAQAAWRWVPEEEKETPEAKRGDGWIHSGDKPQFQEASQKWQMASEKPDLSYQKEGKKVAKKVATNAAGEVSVAADSPKAEANIKKAKAAGKRAKERKAEKKTLAAQAEQEAREADAKAAASSAPAALDPEGSSAKPAAGALAEEETAMPAPLELRGREERKASREASSADGEEPAPVVELKAHREEKESKKAKGPALNPLEFLQKKKKEKLSKEATEAPKEEEKENLPAAEQELIGEEKPKKTKRELETLEDPAAEKKNNKSGEALDRLRAKLGDGLTNEAEDAREEPAELDLAEEEKRAESKEFTEAAEEEEAEAPAPLLIGEKKSRKTKAPALPGLMGLSPKERKKKVLQEVQEMLAEPLPKELPPEEEKRLREKFGLEEAPEVTPEALARKERLDKVKALKESLLELENRQEEERAPETKTHDLTPDEPENTWSQRGGGAEKSVARRAFDSDLPQEEETENDPLKLAAKSRKNEKEEKEDPYFYLPEIELKPIGSAWESAEEHQVYLSGEIRYRGFTRLQDLLPLWIYQGAQKPELLDKTKQWRFLGALPFQAKTLKEVPADVREFLLGLKAGESGEKAEDEEAAIAEALEAAQEDSPPAADSAEEELIGESSPRKKSKGLELAELSASLEEEAEALGEKAEDEPAPERPVTQADTLEEIFERKKKTGSLTEALSESVKSPGIEKFLERRKKKERASEPAAAAQKLEPTNPYLGILVALSNSFGPTKDSQRSVARVLKAIELSFGRCACSILGPPDADGQAMLQIGSGQAGEKVNAEGARAIRAKGDEQILGLLLLKPTEDRAGFSDQEEEVIQKVLDSIWPALARGTERKAA